MEQPPKAKVLLLGLVGAGKSHLLANLEAVAVGSDKIARPEETHEEGTHGNTHPQLRTIELDNPRCTLVFIDPPGLTGGGSFNHIRDQKGEEKAIHRFQEQLCIQEASGITLACFVVEVDNACVPSQGSSSISRNAIYNDTVAAFLKVGDKLKCKETPRLWILTKADKLDGAEKKDQIVEKLCKTLLLGNPSGKIFCVANQTNSDEDISPDTKKEISKLLKAIVDLTMGQHNHKQTKLRLPTPSQWQSCCDCKAFFFILVILVAIVASFWPRT